MDLSSTLKAGAKKLATARAKRKLAKSIPVLGVGFAALSVMKTVQYKGMRRGLLDTALDFTPVLGRVKALYEVFFEDWIPPEAGVHRDAPQYPGMGARRSHASSMQHVSVSGAERQSAASTSS